MLKKEPAKFQKNSLLAVARRAGSSRLRGIPLNERETANGTSPGACENQ